METLAPQLTREQELHWLALRLVPGLGTRLSVRLLQRFQTPEAILRASRSELEANGVAGSAAQSIASGCSFEDAVVQQEKLVQLGGALVTLFDPRYPGRLREIFDPPPLLYARGRIDLLGSLMLGVVGTRRPTPYGAAVTERLSGDLARAGLTIASGMARGIDTVAHRAALEAGGNTVAVLGCGIDIAYPVENRRLAEELAVKGLIVSEFPMCTPAFPQNFPIRNRIISGISAGVLIVEGAQYSGSAITARLALEQGREVFAVPGSIVSKMSWGPNLLIKQGAKLVQDWNDVVEDLSPADRRVLLEGCQRRLFEEGVSPETGALENASTSDGIQNPVARKVLDLLAVETATHIDDLLEKLGDCSTSEAIAALFELELAGAVRQLPGKKFVRVW
ncbi:MAG: DNA-processing protein DprA [Bryobacteraceae bacterium]